MRLRKKHQWLLYITPVFGIILLGIVLFVDPELPISIASFSISSYLLFFPVVFLTLFAPFSYLLLNKRRGALLSLFFTGILILRAFEFTSIFHLIILGIILVLVELFFQRRVK